MDNCSLNFGLTGGWGDDISRSCAYANIYRVSCCTEPRNKHLLEVVLKIATVRSWKIDGYCEFHFLCQAYFLEVISISNESDISKHP